MKHHRFDLVLLTVIFAVISVLVPDMLKKDRQRQQEQQALLVERGAIFNAPIVNIEDTLPPQGTVAEVHDTANSDVKSLICFKTTKSRTVPRITVLADTNRRISVGDHVFWRNGRVIATIPYCPSKT